MEFSIDPDFGSKIHIFAAVLSVTRLVSFHCGFLPQFPKRSTIPDTTSSLKHILNILCNFSILGSSGQAQVGVRVIEFISRLPLPLSSYS